MRIITLCGSTKFKKQFREAEAALTLQGHIVISLGFFEQAEGIEVSKAQEELFARIHLRKIDLADEVLIINVGDYIGKSTRSEIEYAKKKGKNIVYYTDVAPFTTSIHENMDHLHR
ncbi:DUF4406 domain-containing protein [Cytobacillus purgationiresistens]|uniref:DUF4406 domain-containing protein n=1 Tax=Cytobacillus purgationiresistens TaxID=863449 RepID=A0ABU0AB38_9BACI|nr:DUF4406 domain-containing protein [Cytobacillus purgationiresistens]MDQ0268464.1 hypothetical protein [Cytobacillus purgationiresistens]